MKWEGFACQLPHILDSKPSCTAAFLWVSKPGATEPLERTWCTLRGLLLGPQAFPTRALPAGRSWLCMSRPPHFPTPESWFFTSKPKEWTPRKRVEALPQAGKLWFSKTEEPEAGGHKNWENETRAAEPLLQKFHPSAWSFSSSSWSFTPYRTTSVLYEFHTTER